jgi:hypothetical protein
MLHVLALSLLARKIITHANKPGDAHDFYNPTQHAFLDREGGRYIYLEGTYVNTFSDNRTRPRITNTIRSCTALTSPTPG